MTIIPLQHYQLAVSVSDKSDLLRSIPSVSSLLALPAVAELVSLAGHGLVVAAARDVTEAARASALIGGSVAYDWAEEVAAALDRLLEPTLHPVINATGVIVHTNLGRAPLSAEALAAVQAVAGGYCNLEYDVDEGARGSRHSHAAEDLRRLTGAEAALVVNNNAAAALLVLAALAGGREAVVSRGQLVEIGGGFRVPDVMRQGGVRLVEVGTTNRTYVREYTDALSESTALFMSVHRSNFHMSGFVHDPELSELAEAAHAAQLPLYADVGSGTLLDTGAFGLGHEPTVQECLKAGADVVSFSGDKLLGGPQAGIVVGRADLIDRMLRHPLMRALRVDKMTLAALEATLKHYLRGEATTKVPVWRMMAMTSEDCARRAEQWRAAVGTGELRRSRSAVGGGSLPGQELPTTVLSISGPAPQQLVARLRHGRPPLIARIDEEAVVLDPRTVPAERDGDVLVALRQALAFCGSTASPKSTPDSH